MKEVLKLKFNELIRDFNPAEARIVIFEHIRDIPYYLVPQVADPYEWAVQMLYTQKASCSPKHYLLGLYFEELGIPVKYATYPFKWDKQKMEYPDEIKNLTHGLPIAYHVACKAHINSKWITIDATWDVALNKCGLFKINTNWDGESEMVVAVDTGEEIVHETLKDRLAFVNEKRNLYTDQEKTAYAEFINKFNAWLERLRR